MAGSWRAVHHENRLLSAVMKQLAGEAEISFEGSLGHLGLLQLPVASMQETDALKRNTIWPEQDFVILPLEAETIPEILKGMGGSVPHSILHIQIARKDKLVFSACDQFDPHALFFDQDVGLEFLNELVREGLLERF